MNVKIYVDIHDMNERTTNKIIKSDKIENEVDNNLLYYYQTILHI